MMHYVSQSRFYRKHHCANLGFVFGWRKYALQIFHGVGHREGIYIVLSYDSILPVLKSQFVSREVYFFYTSFSRLFNVMC